MEKENMEENPRESFDKDSILEEALLEKETERQNTYEAVAELLDGVYRLVTKQAVRDGVIRMIDDLYDSSDMEEQQIKTLCRIIRRARRLNSEMLEHQRKYGTGILRNHFAGDGKKVSGDPLNDIVYTKTDKRILSEDPWNEYNCPGCGCIIQQVSSEPWPNCPQCGKRMMLRGKIGKSERYYWTEKGLEQ